MLTMRAMENSPHLFFLPSCIAKDTTQIYWSAGIQQRLSLGNFSYVLVVMCGESAYSLGVHAV